MIYNDIVCVDNRKIRQYITSGMGSGVVEERIGQENY
jgi:hypothetical protein